MLCLQVAQCSFICGKLVTINPHHQFCGMSFIEFRFHAVFRYL